VKVSWEDARRGRLIEVEYTVLYNKDVDNHNEVKTLLVDVCTYSLEFVSHNTMFIVCTIY